MLEGIGASIWELSLNTNNLVFWTPLRAAREVQRQIAGWHYPLLPGSKVKGCYSSWLKETPSGYSQAIDWVIRVSVFQYLALYNPIL